MAVLDISYETVWGAARPHEETEVSRKDSFVNCSGRPLWLREIVPVVRTNATYLVAVHGNTFPSIADFDLPADEGSLTERLARRGINCCIFDHRGYGRSFKPKPREPNSVSERARDLAAILRFLVEERGAESFVLLGVSTGCTTIASYLEKGAEQVDSAVFFGPTYAVNRHIYKLISKMKLLRTLR